MRKCLANPMASQISQADPPLRYDIPMDVEEQLALKRGEEFSAKYIKGLPIGLELPNGVVIGKEKLKRSWCCIM